MSRKVSIVPHSHWDREWYAPFEAYRLRLAAMVDSLLDLLAADERFGHFHLDGQVALVDDYLDVRPGAEGRLRALIAAGRLSVGPWYVLMDEFCVSGETLVRNLQLGMGRSSDLGADTRIGYLPDMFGHVAQMPQLLRAAGMSHAVVWRGVPAAVGSSAFWWESPDGSHVRAEYLPVGYAGGAFLPDEPAALLRRVSAHEAELAAFLGADWPMLMMNGGDHQGPQAWLADLLEEANRRQEQFAFHLSSLEEHLLAAPTDGLPKWSGELRSSHRSPILAGVLSSRVDLKQAAAAIEELLERRAEPLAALWLPAALWPSQEIDRAWKEVIRNSAHDSICGCSVDEVGRAVRERYATAEILASHALARAVEMASVALSSPATAVLNSLAHSRSGLVELLLAGTSAPPGTQQLGCVTPGRRQLGGLGRDLPALLGQLAEEGWLAASARAESVSLESAEDGGLVVTMVRDPLRSPDRSLTATMAEAWAVAGAGSERPLTVVVERAGWQRVLAWAADVPGWGWSTWAEPSGQPLSPGPVVVDELTIDNGAVRVCLDPASGSFSLNGVDGQNVILEEGDAGDTYNFCPVPTDDPSPAGVNGVAQPLSVEIGMVEKGPLRAVARVRRIYSWPVGLTGEGGRLIRSSRRVQVEVLSDIEVRAGEPVVRIATSFENRCRDHRVRALFTLGAPARASTAECAFATVSREVLSEGGPAEPPCATFPSRRFVSAGGLTVTHQGLLEYELLGDSGSAGHSPGRSVALTLVRSTGVISRPTLATRPNVAGPPAEVPGAQMQGPIRCLYALAPGCTDPFRMADEVWTPLIPFTSIGGGPLPGSGSRLQVDLGGCRVSALHRRGGALEMRVHNPSGSATTVSAPGHRGELVDLRGSALESWDGRFEVGAWSLVTARFAATGLD